MALSAQQAVARAAAVQAESRRLCESSRELCLTARRIRAGRGADVPPRVGAAGFRLHGTIDGAPVSAEWTPQGLVASEALMTRADLVVRLGETFVSADGNRVPAGLDGGVTRTLLTLMRACDRVQAVSVKLGRPETLTAG